MFFNNYYDEYEMMNESMMLDQFEIDMYAEEMTGDYSDVMNIIIESNEEFYNLQEKMMKLEHYAIVSENSELLQEGISEFKDKAVATLKKIWEKIKAFFRKIKEWFLKLIKKNDKKVKENKDKLVNSDKKVEVKATKGSSVGDEASKNVKQVVALLNAPSTVNEYAEDTQNKLAKKLGYTSQESMKKEMKEKHEKPTTVSGKDVVNLMEQTKKDKQQLDALEKQTDQYFATAIKNTQSNAVMSSDEAKKMAVYRAFTNFITNYVGAASSVMKERNTEIEKASNVIIMGPESYREIDDDDSHSLPAPKKYPALPAPSKTVRGGDGNTGFVMKTESNSVLDMF